MCASSMSEIPQHFIIIVPGYMGSKLRDKNTGEIVWVDFSSIPLFDFSNWLDRLFTKMTYPNDELEPAGIMDEVVFVPPWAKQEHYGRLIEALEGMGYQADATRFAEDELNVYTFAYDWRQDNRISARQLGEAIERWRSYHPGAKAWIIAHSNGGIVSRWYIEKEGGKDQVGKLILMGSPWDGAPKAMRIVFGGLDILFRRRFNLFDIPRRTRDLIRTFPSAYQLIPIQNPFLRDENNKTVDPFTDVGWLSTEQERRLLLEGQRFNQELGTTLSVETLCFFGRKLPTETYGMVRFEAGGQWSDIEWHATEAGDGTVPERSAVHPSAHELPFVASHGDIYVNAAVLEFLEWEFIGQYGLQTLASLTMDGLRIEFEATQDVYSPGEQVDLWATVHEDKPDSRPISGASVEVEFVWRQALPGADEESSPAALPKAKLWESDLASGRYEGTIVAPQSEGYYELQATVKARGEHTVRLQELIAVEALPGE